MIWYYWLVLFVDDFVYGLKVCVIVEWIYEFVEFFVYVFDVWFDVIVVGVGFDECVVLYMLCVVWCEMGMCMYGVVFVDVLLGVMCIEYECEFECCGFGGMFLLKYLDIFGVMVCDKVVLVCVIGCDWFVFVDCGCLLNIGYVVVKVGVLLLVEYFVSFLWCCMVGVGLLCGEL